MKIDTPVEQKQSIKQEIIELSNKLEAKFKMDTDTGICTPEEDVYKELLPEDLSMDVVKKVDKHNSNFVAAAARAFGNLSIEAMAKNKKLDETTITIPTVGKGGLSANMKRTREYANHLGGGEKIIKHGVMSIDYKVTGGSNSGQLKAVKQALFDAAAEKLA